MGKFLSMEETYDYRPDLVCFSHLRWNFVYQRPQHLMSRCARERRVFYVEEPIFEKNRKRTTLDIIPIPSGALVVVPKLPAGLNAQQINSSLRKSVDSLFRRFSIKDPILWYYTPMALPFSRHLHPHLLVYDCMDELAGFRGAPPEMRMLESELFKRADVVFTGGMGLYEAKRQQHRNIHPFPSSIDALHFAKARDYIQIPNDEKMIPHPRLGFSGVIDERMNLPLVEQLAEARPDWSFVFIGPMVKLSESELPHRPNIYYLGAKEYELLPSYMAGWDVAIMPFAHNDSTRFISPTKTPEYLAAGRPVVSTSIRDVVRCYGDQGLVAIADSPEAFISAVEKILNQEQDEEWLDRVDQLLAKNSWDCTWSSMMRIIRDAIALKSENAQENSLAAPAWHGVNAGESDV